MIVKGANLCCKSVTSPLRITNIRMKMRWWKVNRLILVCTYCFSFPPKKKDEKGSKTVEIIDLGNLVRISPPLYRCSVTMHGGDCNAQMPAFVRKVQQMRSAFYATWPFGIDRWGSKFHIHELEKNELGKSRESSFSFNSWRKMDQAYCYCFYSLGREKRIKFSRG